MQNKSPTAQPPMASSTSRYVPKSITMFIAVAAFSFSALMLAYFATNLDTIKKLNNKQAVADSSISFLNGMTTAGLVVTIISALYFAFALRTISKRGAAP
jgi:divalent metal cation (Fe/Co/Zn/Cd) transporter